MDKQQPFSHIGKVFSENQKGGLRARFPTMTCFCFSETLLKKNWL